MAVTSLIGSLTSANDPFRTSASVASGQYQLAFESAGGEGVRQTVVRVRATATRAFILAGAPRPLVDVFLEVRTLLKGLV